MSLNFNMVYAQTLIAVQNGGAPKFYTILQDALTNAQNKDTIYIPGGVYSFSGTAITINKELHLIGTGHHPDSISATGITRLNVDIFIASGADNSTFEGLSLKGGFGAGDNLIHNIKISRCNYTYLSLYELSTNFIISENVIRGSLNGGHAQNNLFSNNVIENYVSDFGVNNIFRNNFFMIPSYPYSSSSIEGCYFQNNVFAYTPPSQDIESNVFENNLFLRGVIFPTGSINSNNIISQTSASTFVNQSGSTFNYSHDYHLKPDSPGKNAGKDGTDIGIYGGTYPWKEGSIPANPHFQSIKINPKTDNSGNLNVRIKVAAQDN